MVFDNIKQLIDLPNTYVGEAPIAVDNCQWIRPAAGDSTVYFDKSTYDRPTFLIYVRDEVNADAASRTDEVLKRIRNYTDSTSSLIVRNLPSFVGKDEKHRSIYTFSIEYQTGGY